MRLSLALLAALALPLSAQARLQVAASGRGSTTVTLAPPRVEGQPAPTTPPATITIDYGQPHARGRAVVGALAADLDKVWRLGANESTTLTAGVDLLIGNLSVPKGEYTLYALTSRAGEWKLIVNKRPKADGNEYVPGADLGRVDLTSRTLATPVESLSFWLIPSGDGTPKGELRFAWGSREFSVPWSLRP